MLPPASEIWDYYYFLHLKCSEVQVGSELPSGLHRNAGVVPCQEHDIARDEFERNAACSQNETAVRLRRKTTKLVFAYDLPLQSLHTFVFVMPMMMRYYCNLRSINLVISPPAAESNAKRLIQL